MENLETTKNLKGSEKLKNLRVVFMGTPDFAVPSLKALVDVGCQIVAVYTQPPRSSGRGYKLNLTPIHRFAEERGFPVRMPPTLKPMETISEILSFRPDLVVVAAYGLLLPHALLKAVKYGCVNVHASLLPRWRGAAPIQRAIMSGATKTGVSIMKMDTGMDTGPVLTWEAVLLTDEVTGKELYSELSEKGAKLLIKTLPSYLENKIKLKWQPDAFATIAPKIEKEEGFLNWNEAARDLERKVRALNPFYSTYFYYKGERIKVLEAEVKDPFLYFMDEERRRTLNDQLHIACAWGIFIPKVLQRPGGMPLNRDVFLRGFAIPAGEVIE
jgi:methionyl-tRNA formyltransferase